MVVVPNAVVGDGVVASFKEVLCGGEPDVYHPLFECFYFLLCPFVAVSHEFCGVKELVSDKSRDE